MTIHPMPDIHQQQLASPRRGSEEDVFPDKVLLRLAAMATILAGVVTFAVLMEWTGRLDRSFFDMVHAGPAWTPTTAPAWWNEAIRDVTALGGTLVLTGSVVASCLYLLAGGRGRLFGLLLGSALAATVFNVSLKLAIARVRPSSVEHLVATTNASFPSGHALLSAAIILTIGGLMAFAARKPVERKVIVCTALFVTLCVGLSRIWLGVHWPSDVFAGWMFGIAWAAVTLWLAKRIDRQGKAGQGQAATSDPAFHRIGLGRQSRS